jgi:hypothetical protein
MCVPDSCVCSGQLCVFRTAVCSGQLCVFRTAMCVPDSCVCSGQLCLSDKWSLFLFMRVMSGLLTGIVLSVIMLQFQYSLKLPFSSTLAYYYYYYYYYSLTASVV